MASPGARPLPYVIKILLSAIGAAAGTGQLCSLWSSALAACLLGTPLYLLLFFLLIRLTASLSAADLQWLRSVLHP